ncbi:MAG: DUF2062 domain-containing protein [Bdellovibrionota bacterium]
MSIVASFKKFGHRRVITPLIGQLKQGTSPDKLASSLAWGFAIALFPILGTTTILCIVIGYLRKLNHVAVQLVNYLAFPLHVALLVPFLKAGDWLFRNPVTSYSLPALLHEFEKSPVDFARHYAFAALGGIIVWAVLIPLPAIGVYYASRPWLTRLSIKIEKFRHRTAE